jgi:hypothetical protein
MIHYSGKTNEQQINTRHFAIGRAVALPAQIEVA